MLKEGSAYDDRLRPKFLLPRLLLDHSTTKNNSFSSSLDRWRLPGSVKDEEQIWRVLDEVFRDAGFTLG